jgi:hypothetical protein
VNVTVYVAAAPATRLLEAIDTSLMTPMMVVVAGNADVAPLAVTVCVNVPPIEGIVVTMTDAVTSVLPATVPEPPSEKVIVCAAELYTAPRIVTVPQPETASTVGFVAMPEPYVVAELAVTRFSVNDVAGAMAPDEANEKVNFELAAPVYGVEYDTARFVTVSATASSVTVVVVSELIAAPHSKWAVYEPAAGIDATATVNEVAATPVKVSTSSSVFHDPLVAPVKVGLFARAPLNPGRYSRHEKGNEAAFVVTVRTDAWLGVVIDAVNARVVKAVAATTPRGSSADFADAALEPTAKKYSSPAVSAVVGT